ncbi:MAG: hypothetical protein R2811_07735 [Flavobacteriales bacterium]
MDSTMKYAPRLVLSSVLSLVLVAGCKKKDDPEPAPVASTGTPQVPAPDAVLRAKVRWSSTLPEQHSGTAYFGSGLGDLSTMTSVELNGLPLVDAFDPGFYTIADGGLDLSNNTATWDVIGDNGFPSFTRQNDEIVFPLTDPITSPLIVDKSDGYTLTCTAVGSADSVAFSVGFVRKVLPGNAASCHFSSADLDGLFPTSAFTVQISGITYRTETIGDKRIRFEKERAWAEPVTIVE